MSDSLKYIKTYAMKAMQKIAGTAQKLSLASIFLWLLSVGSAFAGVSETSFELESPLKDIGGINELVEVVLNNIVLPLGASVAAIAIIYSGFLYVKAQGNKTELERAHEAIKWTIVGTAVILGSWALAQLIGGTIDALRAVP